MLKKIAPAVWFQNKLNPPIASAKKPEVLELFESQLSEVTGGLRANGTLTYTSEGHPNDVID
jgi:hypothetical protein